jgi:hypothetical protein
MFVLWNRNCNSRCQPFLYLIFFHQCVKKYCAILSRPERLWSIWTTNCCSELVLLGKLVTHQNVRQIVIFGDLYKNIPKLTLCHSCSKGLRLLFAIESASVRDEHNLNIKTAWYWTGILFTGRKSPRTVQ